MKLIKIITTIFVIYSFGASANASTKIKCLGQTGKMITHVDFTFDPATLVFNTEFDGTKLSPYIFLNGVTACGQPVPPTTSCKSSEKKDAVNIGDYDFEFSCSDGRSGSLHYEGGTVMAYCTSTTTNQRASENCQITF
ncbi:MAG: hypothetical protein ACXWRE_12000 [Pseudobdellovibrionaceae bacterium]